MRMITACFARALKGWTSRICVHFLLTFQEVMPISKTRNQLMGRGSQTLGRSAFPIHGIVQEHRAGVKTGHATQGMLVTRCLFLLGKT